MGEEEDIHMKLNIVSDGSANKTEVYNAETGERLENVVGIKIDIHTGSLSSLVEITTVESLNSLIVKDTEFNKVLQSEQGVETALNASPDDFTKEIMSGLIELEAYIKMRREAELYLQNHKSAAVAMQYVGDIDYGTR
jgi:hypothetical protein